MVHASPPSPSLPAAVRYGRCYIEVRAQPPSRHRVVHSRPDPPAADAAAGADRRDGPPGADVSRLHLRCSLRWIGLGTERACPNRACPVGVMALREHVSPPFVRSPATFTAASFSCRPAGQFRSSSQRTGRLTQRSTIAPPGRRRARRRTTVTRRRRGRTRCQQLDPPQRNASLAANGRHVKERLIWGRSASSGGESGNGPRTGLAYSRHRRPGNS
jgi:hypothetical protein